MADRGFDYAHGMCHLCGGQLGRKRHVMRVPIFDPFTQGHQELAEYINKAVHQECWDLWAEADTIAGLAIKEKADEFERGLTLAQGEFSGAWGYVYQEVDFSHGSLFLAHSSQVFIDFGPAVGACEIRGRTANLAAIVDMVEAGQLVPGFQQEVPAKNGYPDLHVQCFDYENNRLEVQFTSASESEGLDLTCFLRLDDLQDMRDSLRPQTALEVQPV